MPDTTIKKVEADTSPKGEMGQRYLVAGKRVSMRLWIDEPGGKLKAPTSREYETVGYVISGSAKLDLEGQTLNLKRGDSWLVPAGAVHQYTIIEPFTAVDEGTRAGLEGLLLALHREEPCSIVLVTHDLEEALRLADRIVVLAGRPARVEQIIERSGGLTRDALRSHLSLVRGAP